MWTSEVFAIPAHSAKSLCIWCQTFGDNMVVSPSQVEKTLQDETTKLSEVSGTNHPLI